MEPLGGDIADRRTQHRCLFGFVIIHNEHTNFAQTTPILVEEHRWSDHDILAVYPLRDGVCALRPDDPQLLRWRRKLAAYFLPLLHRLRLGLALGGSNATHTRYQYCKNR